MQQPVTSITIVCLPHSGFQVMQVSQALLAYQEHLEVRGRTIIALILSRNADIPVRDLEKDPLGFITVGAKVMLMGFVFKISFFTACLKSDNFKN